MFDSRCLRPMLLTLALLLAVPWAQAREMVSAAKAEVNMRVGPGTRHEVAWTLIRGYPLAVVGRQGSWLKVRDFENDQGWILKSLTDRKPHHIVKVKVANLRATPTTQGRLVARAAYGDVLATLERRGEWIKVRTDQGRTGWISRRLLWGW